MRKVRCIKLDCLNNAAASHPFLAQYIIQPMHPRTYALGCISIHTMFYRTCAAIVHCVWRHVRHIATVRALYNAA